MNNILEWMSAFLGSEGFAAILSAFAGALSSFISVIFLRYIEVKRNRSKTEAEEFESAVASDHLPTLGSYLRNRLGEVALSAYLNDNTAQSRVNRYLQRLDELVQPPKGDESPVKEPQLDLAVGDNGRLTVFPDDPPAITSAIERLRNGEIWTGLAGLRRDLERHITGGLEAVTARKGPPYKYVEDHGVREMTRRFWHLASRAIHGDDVSPEEASLAVNLAREIYHYLEVARPTSSKISGEAVSHL